MNKTPEESDSIKWEEIYPSLYAFTYKLVKDLEWFRGEKTKTFVSGKTVDDYVGEAICRYLENPKKYNPDSGTFLNYLKLNLIRSLVSNDVRLEENKVTANIFATADEKIDEGEDSESYLDSILPYAEALFDEQIDYEKIMKEIEVEIEGDAIVESIFLGVRLYGMKRREVINELSITPSEYDNGMRRLTTILNKVAKKYNIKP